MSLTWKQAALSMGPALAEEAPTGYDRFSAAEWLEWAQRAAAASAGGVIILHPIEGIPPELGRLLELLRQPDGPLH
jgi:hypothetical protein